MVRIRRPLDPQALSAYRAIRETETFIAAALRDPTQYRRIPTIKVGCGEFPSMLAVQFWSDVLELDET